MSDNNNGSTTAIGIYHKVGSEQNADGTYTSSAMQWCKFKNLEDCIIGYFDFINISRYSNLKGITNPKDYLEKIKADGYAREGFQTIRELDTALVDLKKTTAMNSSQLEEFYFDSNDVAKQMGVTTQAIIEQASAWSRLNKIGLLYGDI